MTVLPSTYLTRLRRLRVSLIALTGVLIAGAFASPASAGEYRVYSCHTPDGRVAPTTGWVFGNSMPYATEYENCSSYDGAMYLGFGPVARHGGTALALTMTLPDSLSIVSMRAQRVADLVADDLRGDQAASPQYSLFKDGPYDDAAHVLESCARYAGCNGSGRPWSTTPSDEVSFNFAGGTRYVGWWIRCGGDPAGWCAGTSSSVGNRIALWVKRTDLTIRDSAAPTVGAVSGVITEAGTHRGTESLIATGDDAGAGIYQQIVSWDGVEKQRSIVDSNGGACADAGALADSDLEFTQAQPCVSHAALRVPIDTTQVADGDRTLTVELRDAAGNRSTVFEKRISVDNVAAPRNTALPSITGEALATGLRPGDVITAVDGAWEGPALTMTRRWQRGSGSTWADISGATGGSYSVVAADIGEQLRVVVTATNTEGPVEAASPATAPAKSGATIQTQSLAPGAPPSSACTGACNGGGGDVTTGQLVVDREQKTVDVKYGAKIVITGRLVDANGAPIANAKVDVFEQLAVTAAPWLRIETVTTDSQGGYVFRPKTTASRRLRFAYAAKRDTADYRATRDVFVSVSAGMSIKAKRHLVSARGVIRLKGRVSVDSLPKTGVWVEVQVLDAGVWRTVATRHTSRTGLWTFNHKVRQSRNIIFKFRARLRASGEVASAQSASSLVKVRVR